MNALKGLLLLGALLLRAFATLTRNSQPADREPLIWEQDHPDWLLYFSRGNSQK